MGAVKQVLFILCLAAALAAPGRVQAVTAAEQARDLATHGKRDEAVRLLRDRLAEAPGDADARTMLGIVLSWEGRYDDARKELETVLYENPTHADALPAAIRVEIWSGNPYRGERLARRGLEQKPDDPTLLVCRARALDAMGRQQEAESDVRRALTADPNNKEAQDLSGRLRNAMALWQVGLYDTYDIYSPGDSNWNETQLYAKRRTIYGPFIGKLSHASWYGLQDDQIELEAYPSIRTGTYAWLNVGVSTTNDLYPEYRLGGDIFQSLPAAFEASLGMRHLSFTGSSVNIYTGYLGKYYRSWLFMGRVYVTPGTAGTSDSWQLGARNYFGDEGGYYGFRVSWGRSTEEIKSANQLLTLESKGIGGELIFPLPRRFELDARVSYSREDRVYGGSVDHYSIGAGIYYSF
jgi:YaiO family outer membrane protein